MGEFEVVEDRRAENREEIRLVRPDCLDNFRGRTGRGPVSKALSISFEREAGLDEVLKKIQRGRIH